ncbi:hypothetical protein NKH77_29095 [Streptomyces sp. M19]
MADDLGVGDACGHVEKFVELGGLGLGAGRCSAGGFRRCGAGLAGLSACRFGFVAGLSGFFLELPHLVSDVGEFGLRLAQGFQQGVELAEALGDRGSDFVLGCADALTKVRDVVGDLCSRHGSPLSMRQG